MQKQRAFTEKEASEYISFSRSFLRKARMNGAIENHIISPPWIILGTRSIRYLKEDLDMWLDSFPRRSHDNES